MEKLEKYYAIFRHKWETFKISEYKNYFVKLIFAVIAGFVAAFVLFLLMRPSSVFTAFLNFIKGSFGAGRSGIAKALNYSAPVMLAAVSVSFSKKAGQFNVGMCGQFVIGAVASVFVFDQCSMPVSYTHLYIKGDENIYSISAASIIAKVTRDRMMKDVYKRQ